MKVYIIGAGTLGRLILEIIESHENDEVGGFYDDGYPELKQVLGYEVIGKIADTNILVGENLAIGIGEPKYRKQIFEEKSNQGFIFPPLIHSSAVISKYGTIEDGVIIGANSSVLNGSRVKKGSCILSHVNINQDVLIESFCLIGAGVTIGNNARLGEGCHIGMANHVMLKQIIEPWTYYNKCDNCYWLNDPYANPI